MISFIKRNITTKVYYLLAYGGAIEQVIRLLVLLNRNYGFFGIVKLQFALFSIRKLLFCYKSILFKLKLLQIDNLMCRRPLSIYLLGILPNTINDFGIFILIELFKKLFIAGADIFITKNRSYCMYLCIVSFEIDRYEFLLLFI